MSKKTKRTVSITALFEADLKRLQKIDKSLKGRELIDLLSHMPQAALVEARFKEGHTPVQLPWEVVEGEYMLDVSRIAGRLDQGEEPTYDTGDIVASALVYGLFQLDNQKAQEKLAPWRKPKLDPVTQDVVV